MEALTSGTLAGTGSFRCEGCGYVLTMAAADRLPACPGCGGASYVRASLFGSRFRRDGAAGESPETRAQLMAEARAKIDHRGQYLVFEEGGHTRTGLSSELRAQWFRTGFDSGKPGDCDTSDVSL